jgi:L-2-amino-thiazoline-4-carboxylic acid hydrolase-like protein
VKRTAPTDIPLIEQVKIQAQVLVPLVKALQAELGEERANSIVRKALADLYRKYGARYWREHGGSDLGATMTSTFDRFAAADALDFQVIDRTADRFDFDVKRCRYAEFFKQIGAPELGFLLVCSADFHMTEGFGAGVQLTRTQTIMQGASHCDFRYARKENPDT